MSEYPSVSDAKIADDQVTGVNGEEVFTVLTSVKLTVERVAYTVCAALEGGSTYWCERFEPDRYPEGVEWGHEAVAMCVPFTITFEDGETKHVENSKQHMLETLQLMQRQHRRDFDDMVNEKEDANTGDVFFQLLCFGEVVYG